MPQFGMRNRLSLKQDWKRTMEAKIFRGHPDDKLVKTLTCIRPVLLSKRRGEKRGQRISEVASDFAANSEQTAGVSAIQVGLRIPMKVIRIPN